MGVVVEEDSEAVVEMHLVAFPLAEVMVHFQVRATNISAVALGFEEVEAQSVAFEQMLVDFGAWEVPLRVSELGEFGVREGRALDFVGVVVDIRVAAVLLVASELVPVDFEVVEVPLVALRPELVDFGVEEGTALDFVRMVSELDT